jgi:dihydroorotate dehydrogenase
LNLYQSLVRPLAFRIDAEHVHEFAMSWIQKGFLGDFSTPLEHDPVTIDGVRFPNRLGLAAGFDKNAVAVDNWHRYGFGYVEIGTVTWHPQPGNPKPRLFRLPEDHGLINRMGFNNEGADIVARRLEKSNPKIPLGINLGKSKITELEVAHQDYAQSFQLLKDLGDYFVVNVSSPNTPGLRGLQDRGPLSKIFDALKTIDQSKPMFLKIAPDLGEDALLEILSVAEEFQLTGVIATNTTISREGLNSRFQSETGGLSGKPVQLKSNFVLDYLQKNKPEGLHLIGVGGVFSSEDFEEKRQLGADLVQLYTGWIYGGPKCAPQIIGYAK